MPSPPTSRTARFAAALAALLAGGPTFASAPTSDERLLFAEVESIVAVSKYEQPIASAPADVTIVTRAEIEQHGWLTLAQALRGVRGFSVTGDRNYDYVGVRGYGRSGDYNGRVLLTVDGHRVNDNLYDQALIGTESPVDLDQVERIEIVRGPGSSLYGSNAVLAVVNLVTRQGRDMGGGEATLLGGSQGLVGGRIGYGQRIEGGEFSLAVSAARMDGERNLAFPTLVGEPNGNVAHDGDRDQWVRAIASLRLGEATFSAVWAQREKRVPTAPFESAFDDPRNRTIDRRGWVEARYAGRTGATRWLARAAVDTYEYEGDFARRDDPSTVNEDRSRGTWLSGEFNAVTDLAPGLVLVAGVEASTDLEARQRNRDRAADGTVTPLLDVEDRLRRLGVYGQVEWRIAPTLDATIGARYDRDSATGGDTVPRLGLVWRARDDLTLKLLYGEAYRAPNGYERVYDDGGVSIKGNPSLEPERIRSAQAIADWRVARDWRLVGVLFASRLSEHIVTVVDPADGLLVNVNAGTETARGAEVEIEGRWANGAEVQLSATTLFGTPGPGVSRTEVKASAMTPLGATAWTLAGEALWQSGRETPVASLPSQTLVNLSIGAPRIGRALSLRATVENLFDATLVDPAGPEHRMDRIPLSGRRFWVTLDVAF